MNASDWAMSMSWPLPVLARYRRAAQIAKTAVAAATASGWCTREMWDRSESG